MKVLSLFDGISCARVALERAGIPVETYWRAEIDKHANAVATARYPSSISLGDVREVHPEGWGVDLLIGGSPCQDLSIAKKGRKGLEGDRSGLFWEYVRIWKEARPRWFILENVASMPKEAKALITETLGVEPVMIDAALVSAQSRKRLFWTNLPVAGLPEDRGILLRDILLPEVDERLYVKSNFTPTGKGHGTAKKLGYVGEGGSNQQGGQAYRVYDPEGKSTTLGTSGAGLVQIGYVGNTNSQGNRIYDETGKSVCLSAHGGGRGAKTGLYQVDHRIRKLDPVECERLQGLPDGYTAGISASQRYKCLGNAFHVEVIAWIVKSLTRENNCVDKE